MRDLFLWLASLFPPGRPDPSTEDNPFFEPGDVVAFAVGAAFFVSLGGLMLLAAAT